VLEGIPVRTIRFEYLDGGLELSFRPAVLDLNPLFVAATAAYLHPLLLAAQLPDDHPRHLTEERAEAALAKAYGMAVIVTGNSPELEEFRSLRSVAEVRTNFVEAAQTEVEQAEAARISHRLISPAQPV
jgi:hypothetical protein